MAPEYGTRSTGLAGISKMSDAQFNVLSAALPDDGRLLEVGTLHGATAARLADAHPGSIIVSVDDFSQCTAENYRANKRKNMHLLIGTVKHLAAHKGYHWLFDVVLIDAMHKYPDCLNDLRHAAPLLIEGGVIFAHDYDALKYPGVVRSVDEFCAESGFAIVGRTDTESTLVELWKQ